MANPSGQLRHLLYIYGTLKTGEPNHRYMLDKTIGSAELVTKSCQTAEKWPLVISSEFNLPFLMKNPGIGNKIKGELYRIDDCLLEWLDDFEDHPNLYVRQVIDVELLKDGESTGELKKVLCYMLEKFPPHMLQQRMYDCYSSNIKPYDDFKDDLTHADQLFSGDSSDSGKNCDAQQ